MDNFDFKKIRFFRGKETPSKKPKTNSHMPVNHEEKPSLFTRLAGHPHIFLVLFAAAIAYLLSYVPSVSLPQLVEGEIATAEIVAPADLTIEDEETTQSRIEEAVEAVIPVYRLDENVFLNTQEKIREFFNSGRELMGEEIDNQAEEIFIQNAADRYNLELTPQMFNELISLEFATSLEDSLRGLIGKVSDQGIIIAKNLFIHEEETKGLTLIKGARETTLTVNELLDKNQAKTAAASEIDNLDLPREEKNLLKAFSNALITQNISYDPTETALRQEAARRSVDTVFYTIKKGKVIIRRGDEVTQEVLKQITVINLNLSAKPSWMINFGGTFILFIVLFLALLYYLKSRNDPQEALNRFIMISVTLILSLLFYKVSLFLGDVLSENSSLALFKYSTTYRYAFPITMGALLFTYLFGIHLALIYTILNSVLLGYLFKANFEIVIFALIGGFAAIWGVRFLDRHSRTSTLKAGAIFIAPLNAIILATFHLLQGAIGPAEPFLSEMFMGIIGGLISGALAFLFLPVYELLFGVITQARLNELSNSDLPIFRKMAMEAPGSYHHSLVVASLAETAAEEMELDPLIVKAGALYHDIGKTKRPEYFIENRTRNFDMHKDLKPSMSSLVIINHVKEGVDMATKLRIPKRIRDIIEQHHGTSLVRYFYEKAKEKYDPEMQKIGEESYRYAGPKPKSKEAALVMLADSVEAASRSIKNPSKPNLKRLITEIFNSSLQDGQLDDSNFSLNDLQAVAASFLNTLYTIYHPRVEYPGFKFEGKTTKPANNHKVNDRNSQSAKKT